MNEYKVLKYTNEYKDQWDAFVNIAKNATFLFKRDFMEYHKDRFEDFSLLVFDAKNNLSAIIPANIVDTTVYSHQGLTYGGIVICDSLKYSDYVSLSRQILHYLFHEGIAEIRIKATPTIYQSNKSAYFDSILPIIEGEIIQRETSLAVDLSQCIKFSSSKRQSVSMSKKNGLSIIETDSFSEYWNKILIPNLWKKFKEKPVHSLEEISALKEKFPNNIKQFNVYKDDDIIAGVTIFESELVAHSQYSSGKKEFNSLRGLDHLLDYLINNRFKDKEHFSFGTSTANKKGQINKGLFTWKEGFGSMPISQTTYRIKTSNFDKLNSLFI